MEKRHQWILAGYTLVAEQGMHALHSEHLANILGKSKSSFYHYFGKLEDFRMLLLEYHVKQAVPVAAQLEVCENYVPDMLNVLIENKIHVLFHKQLRIHRDNPIFEKAFTKAFKQIEKQILNRLNQHFGIEKQPLFAKSFLNIVTDNLLMRITHKNFTFKWLKAYTEELSYLLIQMKSV